MSISCDDNHYTTGTSFNSWFFTDVPMTECLLSPPSLFRILADITNAVVWIVSILPLTSDSPVPFSDLGVRYKSTNYNWYHRHNYVPKLFQLLGKIEVIVNLFILLYFHSLIRRNGKIHKTKTSFFSLSFCLVTTAAVRSLAIHHENYPSKTNQTCGTLLDR